MAVSDFVPRAVKNQDAYTVTTGLNAISGSGEHEYLLLKNPSGSGKTILVTHFLFGTNSSSARSIIRIYSNPTITADGTALTPANTFIGASPKAAEMEAYMNPTVSSNGGILNMAIQSANSPSRGLNRFYWVESGGSVLVTIENSVGNAPTFADIYWLEDV